MSLHLWSVLTALWNFSKTIYCPRRWQATTKCWKRKLNQLHINYREQIYCARNYFFFLSSKILYHSRKSKTAAQLCLGNWHSTQKGSFRPLDISPTSPPGLCFNSAFEHIQASVSFRGKNTPWYSRSPVYSPPPSPLPNQTPGMMLEDTAFPVSIKPCVVDDTHPPFLPCQESPDLGWGTGNILS